MNNHHVFFLAALALALLAPLVPAGQSGHGHQHEMEPAVSAQGEGDGGHQWPEGIGCERRVEARVNGLVCDFCARALEKVFGKREEVDTINVDLGAGRIAIALNEGRALGDELLNELIVNSGYNVVSVRRGCEIAEGET